MKAQTRSLFTSEQNKYIVVYCQKLKDHQLMDWKFFKTQFNQHFHASRKKQELQEQYDYLEGKIRTRKLSDEEKEKVINLKKEGKSFRFIAQQLQRRENLIKNYYFREYKKVHEKENQERENNLSENLPSINQNEITFEANLPQDEQLWNWLEQEPAFDLSDSSETQ
jgi:hypothetical protein